MQWRNDQVQQQDVPTQEIQQQDAPTQEIQDPEDSTTLEVEPSQEASGPPSEITESFLTNIYLNHK